GRAERGGELAHGDLVQLAIVDPDALAVAHDDLVGGLVVDPAKATRPLKDEAAFGLLHELAVAVDDLLLEGGARRVRAVQELLVALEAGGAGGKRDEQG